MLINFKTEYNFLKSAATIDKIIDYAVKHRIKHIGICDYGSTFSNFKFYNMCIENDIKPIIGVEFNIEDQEYLMYAKNFNGIIRLNELTTQYKTYSKIKFNAKELDLIVVIGRGQVSKKILKHQESQEIKYINQIFDHVYFGLFSNVNDPVNYERFIHIKETGLKPLLIDPIMYIDDEDYETFITLNAISQSKKYLELNRQKAFYKHFQLKKYLDLNFKDFEYNQEFINLIDIKYPNKKTTPPKYPYLKENVSAYDYLTALCQVGLNRRLNNQVTQEYKTRLMYELGVIDKMGYSDYFLIMWDIVLYAKKNNIYVGPGRGSAAGSLVSYTLGITDMDPVYYNFLFERFLNPERVSMPDIDVDFEDSGRNQISEYIFNRFGHDHACKIATISKLQPRSAYRDVAKVFDVEPNKIDYIAKLLVQYPPIPFKEQIKTNKKIQSEMINSDKLKLVFDIVNKVEGLPRQTSIHASGIIISERKITDYTAVDIDSVSLSEAHDLEAMGLLKFDILSLSNLTFLHRIVDKINETHQKFTLNDIKLNDQATFKILSEGKTLGIFQVESTGMRSTIMHIKPNRFEDIANCIALYRPGPREFIPTYAKMQGKFIAKNKIDKLLIESNGIILYQEQIILIAVEMAGFSLGQADVLRRAISKKDENLINSVEDDFIKRGVARGYSETYVRDTFKLIAKFANYGFNKAHAYSYSMIVYQMAYLKAHYSQTFYAELFYYNFKSSKRDEFLNELKNQNIELLQPSILYSDFEVSIEKNALRMGLITIDGIGNEICRQIIVNRQYIDPNSSFEETISKIFDGIKINKTQIERLIDAGCFSDFEYNNKTLKTNIPKFLSSDILDILNIMSSSMNIKLEEEYTFLELATMEKKALGINIRYKYFNTIKTEFERRINQSLLTIDELVDEHNINKIDMTKLCVFKIRQLKEIKTKKNDEMAFITIESEKVYEMTAFPKIYGEFKNIINDKLGANVVGLVKIEGGSLYLQKL